MSVTHYTFHNFDDFVAWFKKCVRFEKDALPPAFVFANGKLVSITIVFSSLSLFVEVRITMSGTELVKKALTDMGFVVATGVADIEVGS